MAEASSADIRAWARAHGHPVADRGRLAASLVTAYEAAHPGPVDDPPVDPPADAPVDAPVEPEPAPVGGRDAAGLDPGWPSPPERWRPAASWAAPPPPPPPGPAAAPGEWEPQPWSPRPVSGTDPYAVASILLGLLPVLCGLVAVIFGIVALGRIRHSRQDGRGLAIAGISLGSVWMAAFLAGALWQGLNQREEATEPALASPSVTTGRPSGLIDALRVGDCQSSIPADRTVITVPAVPCQQPHRSEVYAVFALPGTTYPGPPEVDRLAGTGCEERLGSYVGPARKDAFEIFYSGPNAPGWQAGNRTVICILAAPGGALLPPGSARVP